MPGIENHTEKNMRNYMGCIKIVDGKFMGGLSKSWSLFGVP